MIFRMRLSKFFRNFVRSYQDSSTIYMDASLYTVKKDPITSVQQFFAGPVSKIRWNRDEEAVVMDMGCGPGNLTARLILPFFPNLKKLYAVDLQQNMIDYAKLNHPHPKVEFCMGDISQWSSVAKWEGQISNFFSILAFHWVKDQKQGFTNVYNLLKPGGHGVLFFVLESPFYLTCMELQNDKRWNKYLKDCDLHVPPSHTENYESDYYVDMLSKCGFSIEYCKSDVKIDVYPSDDVYREFYSSICVILPYVPTELREEFKKDLFHSLLRQNGRVEGFPVHRGRMLELIIKRI